MNTILEENELLKPKVDVVFHALFREENKKLTEALISDILGEPVKVNRICQWMMFLDNLNNRKEMNEIMEKNEKIKEAVDELTGMSEDEELRILAELREKGRRDEYARRQYAIEEGLREGRERGLAEGRAEGREEGREEGKIEGRKEGIEEGEKREKIKVARKMLELNVSVEIIVKSTGLEKEEIERLK